MQDTSSELHAITKCRPKWVDGSGLVVVLSLSSVPEATGSHVHDKNMHTLLVCSRPIFFLPIIPFSFSLFCIFSDNSSFFQLPSLASASIVPVFYIDAAFLHVKKFHVEIVSIGQKRTV